MRRTFSSLLLLALATPAFAEFGVVPEPGTMSLVGLGIGAAIWLAARKKK
jgi:hypothetical protein